MTKNDYISREAAIEKIRVAAGCAECVGNSSVLCVCDFCDVYNAIRLIKSLPAADVEPVRYGKWEPGNPICPVCGNDKFKDLDADIWCDWTPDYCPNCGAKMDLEEDTYEV